MQALPAGDLHRGRLGSAAPALSRRLAHGHWARGEHVVLKELRGACRRVPCDLDGAGVGRVVEVVGVVHPLAGLLHPLHLPGLLLVIGHLAGLPAAVLVLLLLVALREALPQLVRLRRAVHALRVELLAADARDKHPLVPAPVRHLPGGVAEVGCRGVRRRIEHLVPLDGPALRRNAGHEPADLLPTLRPPVEEAALGVAPVVGGEAVDFVSLLVDAIHLRVHNASAHLHLPDFRPHLPGLCDDLHRDLLFPGNLLLLPQTEDVVDELVKLNLACVVVVHLCEKHLHLAIVKFVAPLLQQVGELEEVEHAIPVPVELPELLLQEGLFASVRTERRDEGHGDGSGHRCCPQR
mmetsp:Transcript_17464/g.39574  ORF Transcript_17464/g.39574 Transcript_17464/m.39574 type:complete len:351 (+) Transcript_17464:1003-2055(+)